MSLRIIVKPQQVHHWIAVREGQPARRAGTDTDVRVLFAGETGPYEPISFAELIEIMKASRLSLLVDEEPGKTYHKFIEHS